MKQLTIEDLTLPAIASDAGPDAVTSFSFSFSIRDVLTFFFLPPLDWPATPGTRNDLISRIREQITTCQEIRKDASRPEGLRMRKGVSTDLYIHQ